jgi:hypothetical protein
MEIGKVFHIWNEQQIIRPKYCPWNPMGGVRANCEFQECNDRKLVKFRDYSLRSGSVCEFEYFARIFIKTGEEGGLEERFQKTLKPCCPISPTDPHGISPRHSIEVLQAGSHLPFEQLQMMPFQMAKEASGLPWETFDVLN